MVYTKGDMGNNNFGGINAAGNPRPDDIRDDIANQIMGGITDRLGKETPPEHQLIRDDFHAFGRLIMGREDKPFHTKMRQMLMDESNALFLYPRGFGKSSLIVEYALWRLGKDRDLRIIVATNALRLGIEWMREIETVMASNKLYREVYGDLIPESRTGTWTDTEKIVNGRSPKATHTSLYVVSSTGSTLGKRADVILCLPPSQKIITIDGEKPVSEVAEGDFIMTAWGAFEPVMKTLNRDYNKELRSIKVQGFVEPLLATPEHPLLYESSTNKYRNKFRQHNNRVNKSLRVRREQHGEWKKAEEIVEGGYLLLPVNTKILSDSQILDSFKPGEKYNFRDKGFKQHHLLEKDMWRYIGYWLAEGSSSKTGALTLAFNSNETHLHNDVINIGKTLLGRKVSTYIREDCHCASLVMTDVVLRDLLLQFRINKDKCVPFWVELLPLSLQNELVKGYYLGDGYYDKEHNIYRIISVSLPLVSSIQRILLRLGIISLQYKATVQEGASINGRLIKHARPKYELRINPDFGEKVLGIKPDRVFRKHRSMAQLSGGYLHVPVRSNTTIPYEGKVYNLSVWHGHSYCCTQCATHNCDDVFEPEMGQPSESQIRRVKEWFWKVLYPVLEPGIGKIFTSGTRFHALDLYGELIDRDWPYLIQAAIITDPVTGEEKSAWPERFSLEELQKRRNSMGSIMFNLQYQNNADISSRLQLEFLHFVPEDEIPKDLVIYQGVDPCLAVGANPDYFAMATIGVSEKTGKGYLLDLVRARIGFHQQLEVIMQQAAQWNPRKIGIETNAAQVFLKESLQDAEDSPSPIVQRMAKRKFQMPIIPIISRVSKQSRIMEMSALFESGLISIKAVKDGQGLVPTSNLEPFVNEWLMFPQGKNDDALDAVTHCIKVCEFGLPPPISTYKEPDLPFYRRRERLTLFHK